MVPSPSLFIAIITSLDQYFKNVEIADFETPQGTSQELKTICRRVAILVLLKVFCSMG
jgi:hypothetical protein